MSRAVSGSSWAVRHGTALGVLALVVLSLALHARTLSFGFVNFDDPTVLLAHPQLYDETSLLASLSQIFFEAFPREEPLLLRDVSWAIDARVFGFQNPLGYHLGNVLLNAANVALLFLFLARATRRFGLSLAIAGVFAVLPVHVEPVSWVMGARTRSPHFFVLAALLVQSFELDEADARRRRQLHLATLLCTCLALVSKIAAMPCFVLLALHRAFHPYLDGRRAPDAPIGVRRTLRAAIPPVLPHAVLTVAIVAWYQAAVAEYGVTGWRGRGPLDPEHLANVAAFTPLVIGSYWKSLVWPSQLSVFYRWPHVEIPLTGAEQFASVAMALAIVAALVYCCLRRRDLAFYLLAFLALLFPYLNIVYVDIWRANRYVYLASFCALAVPAILLAQLYARGTRAIRIRNRRRPRSASRSASAAQTLRLQAVWRDDASLWALRGGARRAVAAGDPVARDVHREASRARDGSGTAPRTRPAGAQRSRTRHWRAIASSVACRRVTRPPSRSRCRASTRCSVASARSRASRSKRSSRTTPPPTRSPRIAPAPTCSPSSISSCPSARRRPSASAWCGTRGTTSWSTWPIPAATPSQLARNAGMITAIYEQRYPFLHPRSPRRGRACSERAVFAERGATLRCGAASASRSILPTYNEKDSIRRCIEAFEATGVVDEIIVVNNNATPGTSDEVGEHGRARGARADPGLRRRDPARLPRSRAATSSWSRNRTEPSAPATCASCSPTPRTSRSSTAAARSRS